MGYNAALRQSSYTAPPVGQEPSATLTQSNLDDQVMSVQNPDGTSTQLSYDSGGRLSAVVGSAGTTTVAYGTSGHVTQLTAPGGEVLRRGRDGSLRSTPQLPCDAPPRAAAHFGQERVSK